jgi:cob(I)alamin adenosyltransferase
MRFGRVKLEGAHRMIHVYTGNGKGKTTAALGLAVRAAGAGLKVFIAQFAKGRSCSELKALKKIGHISCAQFGTACFIRKTPTLRDKELAARGLAVVMDLVRRKQHDMIVLDEINVAVHLGLIDSGPLVCFLRSVPKDIEIVLTGRWAHPAVLRTADLISEIKEVRHYYRKKVKARKGIEF